MEEQYNMAIFAQGTTCGKMGVKTCVARSKDEAVGVGIRFALDEFPQAEGYYNHAVAVSSNYLENKNIVDGNSNLQFLTCHCGTLLAVAAKGTYAEPKNSALGIMVQQMIESGYELEAVSEEWTNQLAGKENR